MNASLSNYEDQDFNYRSTTSSEYEQASDPPSQARRSKELARRRGKAPAQFNGIHRRRRKRMSW